MNLLFFPFNQSNENNISGRGNAEKSGPFCHRTIDADAFYQEQREKWPHPFMLGVLCCSFYICHFRRDIFNLIPVNIKRFLILQ